MDKRPKDDPYRPRKIGKWTMRPFTKFLKEKDNERKNAAWKKAMDKFGNKISTQQLTTVNFDKRTQLVSQLSTPLKFVYLSR